jgi:hypothetical protein
MPATDRSNAGLEVCSTKVWNETLKKLDRLGLQRPADTTDFQYVRQKWEGKRAINAFGNLFPGRNDTTAVFAAAAAIKREDSSVTLAPYVEKMLRLLGNDFKDPKALAEVLKNALAPHGGGDYQTYLVGYKAVFGPQKYNGQGEGTFAIALINSKGEFVGGVQGTFSAGWVSVKSAPVPRGRINQILDSLNKQR